MSLICLLILAIPLYSSTNNKSWIDYYYQDDVNTMDALIVSIQLVLVGFVLHMVGGVYVVMLLARTLIKLEDGASNMATRSRLAAWMDAVIERARGLCKRHGAHCSCDVINCTSRVFRQNMCRFHYSSTNITSRVTNESITVFTYHQFHNRVRHSDYQFVHSDDQV